jgi:hypothetical protein
MGKPSLLKNLKLVAVIGLIVLGSMLQPSSAWAVDVPALYTAEVPYDETAKNPRKEAYRAALGEVLARVSGAELSNNTDLIEQLIPSPSSYVTQFRFGNNDSLWVSFDGPAIEQILRDAGLTVWGGDRPATLVWLAIDWGRGEREILGAGDPNRTLRQSRSIDRNLLLRERILEIAAKRGLPIIFPLQDTADLQAVTFSDVWGGFDERVLAASQRYDVNSVLIGRLRPSSSQRNRWTYFFGFEQRSWSGTPEAVITQVADLLAAEFAIGGNEPLQFVALNVSGIASLDAFGSLQTLLGGIQLIENYRVQEVSGDTVRYQVEVRGGAARLRRALLFTGLIEQDVLEPASGLDFFYGPDPMD